jgi:hypothetical protein
VRRISGDVVIAPGEARCRRIRPFATMSTRSIHLICQGRERRLERYEELSEFLRNALRSPTTSEFALELRRSAHRFPLQGAILALLGMETDLICAKLTVSWASMMGDSWAYITYAEGDEHWVPNLSGVGADTAQKSLVGGQGDLLKPSLTVEQAIGVIEEFYRSQRRPRQIEWRPSAAGPVG